MPNVTVLGASGASGPNVVWTIPYSSNANSSMAQGLANQITASILNSSLSTEMWGSGGATPSNPYVLAIGGSAGNGFTGGPVSASITMTDNMRAVVDNSTLPVTVNGIGASDPITVIGGQGGLTFNSGLSGGGVGSGFILDGGQSGNLINIEQTSVSGGGYWISPGDGANTVFAGGGNNTITGAAGSHNMVDLSGFGNNLVALAGIDTVTASSGSGSDTIGVGANDSNPLLVSMGNNWTGHLIMGDTSTVGGGALSVMGGGGSVTLFGGAKQDVFFGGSAGTNFIVGGSDPTSSITGGGNGDQLFAGYYGGGVIQAGTGNETLVGAGRPGINGSSDPAGTAFFANTLTGGANIFAGAGPDTITAGAGQENFYADATGKGDFFIFAASITGAAKAEGQPTNVLIQDFTVGKDTVALSNYGFTSATDAMAHVSESGGNSVLQLNDGTKIEFANVVNLTTKNFQT